MNKHTLTTLKTGLRVVTIPMPQLESLSIMVGVKAGCRDETESTNGLSHFLEHMAFKGTQKRPNTMAISSAIDQIGGEFNAYTDREITIYFIKLAAKHQKLGADILSDMLTNSLYKTEEIEREKGVICEEINMREDNPMEKAWISFDRLLYGDNSLGWDIAGEKPIIQSLKRANFIDYINRLYYPENMVLTFAGKITSSQALEMAYQYFGHFKRTGRHPINKYTHNQHEPRLKLINKKTEQAHFMLGCPGYSLNHKDRYVVGILATILGGGMSSRLFTEIRERRGLAYYVNFMSDFNTDCGYVAGRAGVKLDQIEEAIRVMKEEYRKMTTKKVSLKELRRNQELYKGRLILSMENSQEVANRFTHQFLLRKEIQSIDQVIGEIDRVTEDDILRVAKDLLKPAKLNLAVVGPYPDSSRFKRLLP